MHSAAHPAHSERLHALDALRAIAMLLGIALHASLAYLPEVFQGWPADDPAGSPLFYVVFMVIHIFRMETFFFMAGFFGCMLLARDGARAFAIHRAKRIVLPLVLGMLTVIPVTHIAWAWGLNLRLPDADRAGLGQAISNYNQARGPTGWLQPIHLWFLQHLIVLYVLAALGHSLCERVRPIGVCIDACTSAWAWTVREGLAAVPLTLIAFPLLLLQQAPGADTQIGWYPQPGIVAYYSLYFTAGWLLYRRRHDLPGIARFWILQLTLAITLAMVFLTASSRYWEALFSPDTTPGTLQQHLVISQAIAAPATAMFVVSITGLFLRSCTRSNRTMRYIADSAYWMYIVHLPLVVVLNWLVYPIPAPAVIKFVIVCAAAFAILLGSYQFVVRYTWIGVLLNGPKLRDQRARQRAAASSASAC